MWGGENDKCENRIDRQIDALEHLVTECKAYEEERKEVENKIWEKIGEGGFGKKEETQMMIKGIDSNFRRK